MNDQEILAFALTCGITAIVLFAVAFRWKRQDRPKPAASMVRSNRLDATDADLLGMKAALAAVPITPPTAPVRPLLLVYCPGTVPPLWHDRRRALDLAGVS